MTQNANGGETKKLNMSGALAATAQAIAQQPEAVKLAILASLPESDRDAIQALWAMAAEKSKVVLPCPQPLIDAYVAAYRNYDTIFAARQTELDKIIAQFADRMGPAENALTLAEDALPEPYVGRNGEVVVKDKATKKRNPRDPSAPRATRMRGAWNITIDGKSYTSRAAAAQSVDSAWCTAHPTADVFDSTEFRKALDKESTTIHFTLTAGEWTGKTKRFVESFKNPAVRVWKEKQNGEIIYQNK